MSSLLTRAFVATGFGLSVVGLSLGLYYLVGTQASVDELGSVSGALQHRKPKHRWRSVRGRHWQIISTEYEEASATDAREGTRGACLEGMVEVSGDMALEPDRSPFSKQRIGSMQLATCVDWIQKDYPERCARFDRDAWLSMIEGIERKPMHFCIDRFEYPNRQGQYPIIYASWYEASELCEQQGKRLCNEDEWTFACEGEEAKPYPYGTGYVRDAKKCITDQKWMPYNQHAMHPRDGDAAGLEMDRLWRGKFSGEQPECRSEFGVHDMTGNVDEWTTSVRPGERPSILKGGYWGPVRTRCRPTTRSHDQNHMFYQQGFRCCAGLDAKLRTGKAEEPTAAPIPRALQ
jgi:hypothetical protein